MEDASRVKVAMILGVSSVSGSGVGAPVSCAITSDFLRIDSRLRIHDLSLLAIVMLIGRAFTSGATAGGSIFGVGNDSVCGVVVVCGLPSKAFGGAAVGAGAWAGGGVGAGTAAGEIAVDGSAFLSRGATN